MPPDWSIGIWTGDSPLHLKARDPDCNPVLTARDVTDLDAAFVADPFMLQVGGAWYMFFEVLPKGDNRGRIAVASSDDALVWRYLQVVLTEDYHLSYPYVFESGGRYYMIPETLQPRAIQIYTAVSFPTEWRLVADLVNIEAADPSILQHDGKWWLFACTRRNDQLSLYYADDPMGPWMAHPGNPIVDGNAQAARPAGRVLSAGGRLIRFAQDCSERYGSRVRAYEILQLTTETYEEQRCVEGTVAGPSGSGWNGSRMHHIDAHRLPDGSWIACVDGC
jgi:hypothetical protein